MLREKKERPGLTETLETLHKSLVDICHGRFFHAKGDPVNARAVLQPSFAVIIEGHHTPALEEAATLLEVLERDID